MATFPPFAYQEAAVRRRVLSVALCSLALLGLGGCGSDDEAGETAATTGSTAKTPAKPDVTIEMRDYAYAVTGKATAGYSTLELSNTGTEFHMVALVKLKAGKTVADAVTALQSEKEDAFAEVEDKQSQDAPSGLISPGARSRITTNFLTEGRYALVCGLPEEGTGAPHFTKGMVGELTVAGTGATEAPEVDATYTIGSGKIEGPKTLKAGKTAIAATLTDGRHSLLVIRKDDPKLTFEAGKSYFEGFEKEGGPPKGFAKDAAFTIEANVFDYEKATVYLDLDLKPGVYFIGCNNDADEEAKTPEHHEILEVTVT